MERRWRAMPFCGLSLAGNSRPLFHFQLRATQCSRRVRTSVRAVSEPTSIRRGRAGCYSETHGPARKFFFLFDFLILSISTGGAKGNLLLIYTLVNGGQVGGGMENGNPTTLRRRRRRRREWKGCVSFWRGPAEPKKNQGTNWNSWKRPSPWCDGSTRIIMSISSFFRAWILWLWCASLQLVGRQLSLFSDEQQQLGVQIAHANRTGRPEPITWRGACLLSIQHTQHNVNDQLRERKSRRER